MALVTAAATAMDLALALVRDLAPATVQVTGLAQGRDTGQGVGVVGGMEQVNPSPQGGAGRRV